MILGAEIALLLLGLYAIFTGKLTLAKQRIVWGPAARFLGIIACAPVPVSFIAQTAYLRMHHAGPLPVGDALRWTMIGIEGGVLVVCTAMIYAIGWTLSEPSAEFENRAHRLAMQSSVAVSGPSSGKGMFVAFGIGAVAFGVGFFFIAYGTHFFAASSTETADSDINQMPPKPEVAGPVPELLLPAPWQSRMEQVLNYNRRSLATAYEQIGKKNPNWDTHAHTALELAAKNFSLSIDPQDRPELIRAATQRALAAGCDDPLILYLHVRFASSKTPDAELDRGYAKAAKAMLASAYPPSRRAAALWKYTQRKLKHDPTGAKKTEILPLIDATVRLLPASAREEERCPESEDHWHEVSRDAMAAYQQLHIEPNQAFARVSKVLRSEKALESTLLLLQGDHYLQLAWKTRGDISIKMLPPNIGMQFNNQLTLARTSLEQSWQLAPDYGRPATLMLRVELGQSRGRDEMEKWFDQAIKLEPTKYVCSQKLEWLHPKWHGSKEEMLAFGRACRDSENWARGFPLIVVEAHGKIAEMMSNDAAISAYYRQPDVAADILYVFAKSLEHNPEDNELRSRYAYYSYHCGHPRRAHAQFERLGDKLWWGGTLTEARMKNARAKAAKEANQTNTAPIIINAGK